MLTKSAFSMKQVTLMLISLLFAGGLVTYQGMPRAEDPGYIMRVAQIRTSMPGASPERMEQLVTDKIEKYIQEIPEVDYIYSESKTGFSVIEPNILEKYKEMQPIWDNLRRKVEDAERELPEEAHKPFVDDEFGDVYGTIFAITGEGFTYATIKDIADDIRDELLLFPEIAKVSIFGAQEERVFIDYNNERLAEVGLSAAQLGSILSQRNIIQTGGTVNTPTDRLSVEPSGNFQSVEDIRKTLIQLPQSRQVVALEDLARVYRGYIDPPTTMMRVNGRPCLGIAVSMMEGGNIISLGKDVREYLKRAQAEYPVGIEFTDVYYQSDVVTLKIEGFEGNLYQAIGIVCAVMLLFLGLRTGLIVASLIPVAIVITFVFMSFFDIGLDQVSLASLIIALGMLVDNSIVVSESTMVKMAEGMSPVDAALSSSKELSVSLLISSLTTAAAFLPIVLAEVSIGEYTSSIFKVVTITLLVSWTVSLTFILLLCTKFLKVEPAQGGSGGLDTPFYRIYRKILTAILKVRFLALVIVIGIFVLAMYGMSFVPKVFFPPNDAPYMTMELELPMGASIEATEAMVERLDEYILANHVVEDEDEEGILSWATYIGEGGPRYRLQHSPEPPNPYYTFSLVTVTSYEATFELEDKLNAFVGEAFPDVKTKIRALQNGTPVDNPVEIRISGKEMDKLFEIVEVVKAKIEGIRGTHTIADDWGQRTNKIVINIDEPKARLANVTHTDVARSLEAALSGVELTQYREDDKLIPVVLRSVAARDSSRIQSETFSIFAEATGESVPLQQVADVKLEWQVAQILRRDRSKTITAYAALQGGQTAAAVNKELIPWLEEYSKEWPLGYRWEVGGDDEESAKATGAIADKLPIAGFIILLLLMLQFNSVKTTAIILATIPLALIGVTIGLLVAKSYFGFMTLLGIISLAGIVINNAIVLLDRINLEINENGLTPQNAILTASQRRLRPILLTTATTVMGMLPLWFGGGSLWESMAITIIFGLLFSTLLTLGVVPVLYAIFNGVSYKDHTDGQG